MSRASILLNEYKNPPMVTHEDMEVQLTTSILMDYGHLYQTIFLSGNQTDEFDYALSWCILFAWEVMPSKPFIEVLIKSKALEFRSDLGYEGHACHTQHRILINNHSLNPGLISCETTWSCINSA